VPRSVRFETVGAALAGLLFLPENSAWSGPFPAVIVCHGLGSRKENHSDFAGFLAKRGFAALVFDFRGHGQSSGYLDANTLEDVRCAIAFLKAQREIDAGRIAVRGSSMGGLFALHAGAEFDSLRAVVAICPAPEEILRSGLLRAERDISVLDRPLSFRVNLPDFLEYLERRSVFAAAPQIAPRPLMLVHARGDEVIPYTSTERLYEAAGEPKSIALLDGGSHTSAQHDPRVHELVTQWLEHTLGSAQASE